VWISISSPAEGLAEAYDLFQAGNGWKCMAGSLSLKIHQSLHVHATELCQELKKTMSSINSQMQKQALKLTA